MRYLYFFYYILLLLTTVYCTLDRNALAYRKGTCYKLFFFAVVLIVCLRWGQGTDFFNYMYGNVPHYASAKRLIWDSKHHWEFIWTICCKLIYMSGIPYELFSATIGLISLLKLNKFLKRENHSNALLGFFILFPAFIMTYILSAIRQAFVVCVFLGDLLPLIVEERKQHRKYYLLVILLSFIHFFSLVYFVVPFIVRLLNFRHVFQLFVVSIFISIITILMIDKVKIREFLALLQTAQGYDVKWMAWFEHVAEATIISAIAYHTNKTMEELVLYKTYLIGCIIYFLLAFDGYMAGRIFWMFRPIEAVIISTYVMKHKRQSHMVFAIYLMLCSILYFKNISAFISEGSYYENVNIFNYPYISIFNKSDIDLYRAPNKYRESYYTKYVNYGTVK